MLLALAAGIFALDYKMKIENSEWLQGSRQEILNGRLILRNCHNRGFSGILKSINPTYGTEIPVWCLAEGFGSFFARHLRAARKTARLWSGYGARRRRGQLRRASPQRLCYGLCEPWRWKFQNPKMGFQSFGCVYCPWRAGLGRGFTSAKKEKIKEVIHRRRGMKITNVQRGLRRLFLSPRQKKEPAGGFWFQQQPH